MSTATNLLSLLNQLQLMENSLTNFMLETILKLQSLTETKVFLLLESPGSSENGRRYCGTPDLVEAFEKGQLASMTRDVSVSLDQSANSLVENPRVGESASREHLQQRPRASNKRSLDNHLQDSTSCSGESSSAPPVKRLHVAEEADGSVIFAEEMAAVHEEEDFVKREVEEFVIGDSDDEGDPSKQSSSMINFPFQQQMQPQMVLMPPNNGVSVGDDGLEGSNYRPSNELCARKLEALQSIENASAVFEKGTLENKLLSSILYDYGKELALKCPYSDVTLASAEVKSYFYGNLEQFLSHFQRFTIEKTIVSELLKSQSPQSYMRNIARSGYKAAAKTAMKRRNANSS